MAPEDQYFKDLLARLNGLTETVDQVETAAKPRLEPVAEPRRVAPQPAPAPVAAAVVPPPARTLDALRGDLPRSAPAPAAPKNTNTFVPLAPRTLPETKVHDTLVEALTLKYLLHTGVVAGRTVAEQIGLPFALLEPIFARLKTEQLVVYRNAAALGDYNYQLTVKGMETAERLWAQGSYCGPCPVHFDDYLDAVKRQSLTSQQPTMDDLLAAFQDLSLDEVLLNQIGQALDAGKGFFLYGSPGNGKTSLAERVSEVFGHHVWIPRTLLIDGQIVRLYDPCQHVEVPLDQAALQTTDRRWVRIRRPAIIVGGELTLELLDSSINKDSGVCEAPLQLKSNCGTLVIDDFGRQRCSTAELLNRWIVPLDRGYDFLHLPGGKTVRVPFDQLLVFSTNLQPRDLVDEAFLRRIPYKIEVCDPNEEEFHRLLATYANRLQVAYDRQACEYLVERHYKRAGRPMRRCHARDLLSQVRHLCRFNNLPLRVTSQNFDIAVHNYFALVGT